MGEKAWADRLMDAQPLVSRRALVTGAGGGIGGATSVALASAGAAVTLLGRSAKPLHLVAERIRSAGGEATVARADVTDVKSVGRALDSLPAHDVVVQ